MEVHSVLKNTAASQHEKFQWKITFCPPIALVSKSCKRYLKCTYYQRNNYVSCINFTGCNCDNHIVFFVETKWELTLCSSKIALQLTVVTRKRSIFCKPKTEYNAIKRRSRTSVGNMFVPNWCLKQITSCINKLRYRLFSMNQFSARGSHLRSDSRYQFLRNFLLFSPQ